MDEDLVRLYDAELRHLRTHAAEFAKRGRFRRIASRLGIGATGESQDPFVEWLLDGYAFLAARVQRKLEGEYPRFTQTLLSVVYPHLNAPTPAMILAGFEMRPDPGMLAAGRLLRRETSLTLAAPGGRRPGEGAAEAPVRFTTGRALRLWPIRVAEVKYLPDAASVAAAGGRAPAKAGVLVTLALTPPGAKLSALGAEDLDLYIPDQDGLGSRLHEAMTAALAGCEALGSPEPVSVAALGVQAEAPPAALPGDPPDLDPRDALLPAEHRRFDGWRLLHEFFAFPDRFRFLRLGGLRRMLAAHDRRDGSEATLLFRLDRPFPELAGKLGPEALRLNCVPAVNLFRQPANTVPLPPSRSEHHVVPDRRAASFEVHSVLSATGLLTGGGSRALSPFFQASGMGARDRDDQVFFHVIRRARRRPDLRGDRDAALTLYRGSEAFISVVDASGAGAPEALKAVQLDLMCSNRHLPGYLMREAGAAPRLTSDQDLGWREISVIAGPSSPWSGLTEGRRLWDVISHLSLNYLSLVDAGAGAGSGGERAAEALRQLMRVYAPEVNDAPEAHARAERQIGALAEVSARPSVRPTAPLVARPGDVGAPLAFARGLEVRLRFAEAGRDSVLLAGVLAEVLSGHADVNSFAETVLVDAEGAERARFRPRAGSRPLL